VDSASIYDSKNPISLFREMIDFSDDHNDQKKKIVMQKLYGKIPHKDFVTFCKGFIDGLEYEANIRGIMPSGVFFENNDQVGKRSIASFHPSTHTIQLCRDLIQNAVEAHPDVLSITAQPFMRTFYEGTKPFLLTLYDNAFLLGAHEVFHLYDQVENPDIMYFSEVVKAGTPPEIRAGAKSTYDFIPAEMRVRDRLREIMVERGLVYTAPICPLDVQPDEREWAAPYLRERVERNYAKNAVHQLQEPSTVISTAMVTQSPLINADRAVSLH
jgi:hypothetical protein